MCDSCINLHSCKNYMKHARLGGCSLSFARGRPWRNFSDNCLGVGAGGKLTTSRVQALAVGRLLPIRLQVTSLVGVL